MTSDDPPSPGPPLVEITQRTVADRLEAIFPGLERYATEQHARHRQRRDVIVARGSLLPASREFPPETLMLIPDYILEHAKPHARIASDQIGTDRPTGDSLARRVLRDLWTLAEEILTVSDRQRCFQIHASQLIDFVLHSDNATGDRSFDGDGLFVCTRSPRVIVLHHEGWIFDVSVNTR